MECRIVSVASEVRGRGMAKELIARSLELARQHGFRVSDIRQLAFVRVGVTFFEVLS